LTNSRQRRAPLESGKVVGSVPFTYGSLAYLLKNRTYIGETRHKGRSFDGEHVGIIDRVTFDKVQDLMKSHSIGRSAQRRESGAR